MLPIVAGWWYCGALEVGSLVLERFCDRGLGRFPGVSGVICSMRLGDATRARGGNWRLKRVDWIGGTVMSSGRGSRGTLVPRARYRTTMRHPLSLLI